MPNDRFTRAVQLYQQGRSIQQVAEEYGVTRQSMWMVLKRRGVEMRPHLRYGQNNHFYRGTRADGHAQNVLEEAIEKGLIQRQTICEKCGTSGKFKDGRTAIQAHHPDYGKPLEVMWLCQRCHHDWHKTNTPRGVV